MQHDYRRLAREWPEDMPEKRDLKDTPSQAVRAQVRSQLREDFARFLDNARMHELHLLQNVLMLFSSSTGGALSEDAESVLAEVFMNEMGRDQTYVKVPRRHLGMVEEYVALLNGAGERS